MSEIGAAKPLALSADITCADDCCATTGRNSKVRNAGWHRAAGQARLLAWVSLVWMAAEGAIWLRQGLAVGSIALIGWARRAVQ